MQEIPSLPLGSPLKPLEAQLGQGEQLKSIKNSLPDAKGSKTRLFSTLEEFLTEKLERLMT